MSSNIHIRVLRHVEHTVFAVEDGQKTYFDPVHRRRVPYSSGQQVKRSILDHLVKSLGETRAPITFNYQFTGRETGDDSVLREMEPWSPCDPRYADQLLGGWMRAEKGQTPLRRRSPLSISAMRPLHPLLTAVNQENATFDRSDSPGDHVVRVTNRSGEELSADEVAELLAKINRAAPRRKWVAGLTRASGLYVLDIAIDTSRLFRVSTDIADPEITREMLEELRDEGWTEKGNYIQAPVERRAELVEALASSLLNWQITSNQARTYSPQATLAIAISGHPTRVVDAIRASLLHDTESVIATPVIEEQPGVDLFITPQASAHIAGLEGSANALTAAEECIITQLNGAFVAA